MNSKSLNPLFLGFGRQAQEYVRVLQKKKIKIHSVCVSNLNKRKKTFNKYKITNTFENIDEALNNKGYNCIFVFLPFNVIEKEILKILKKSDVPIYSEKPIALSFKKISIIEQYVKKNKRKLYVLYNRNHYKIFKIIEKFLKKENFSLSAFIPERVQKTIKNIDKKLKGNIKYHLTSHWLNFFFSLKNLKNLKPVFKKNDIFFKKGLNEILISPNSKGYITAIFKSKNHILFLVSLEQLLIFKIKKNQVIFFKYYNEFTQTKFKPGVERIVDLIMKNKLNSNISKIKTLYNSIKDLNY